MLFVITEEPPLYLHGVEHESTSYGLQVIVCWSGFSFLATDSSNVVMMTLH